MQELRNELKKARNELKQKINIQPGYEEDIVLELVELKELEKKLKKYIKQSEEILKQNFKNN